MCKSVVYGCTVIILTYVAPTRAAASDSVMNFTIQQNSYVFHNHKDGATWQEAKDRCADAGAELWAPADLAEQRAMKGEVSRFDTPNTYTVWTGINDVGNTGKYRTPCGQPLSIDHDRWYEGQPDSRGGAHRCVALWFDSSLFVVGCDATRPFVCKYLAEAPPPHATTPPSEHNDQPCAPCNYREFIENIKRLGYEKIEQTNLYLKLHRVPATWDVAHSRCLQAGGVLASPINEQFLKEMLRIMKSKNTLCGVFTGINDQYTPGHFFSVEGIPLEKIPVNFAKRQQCPEVAQHSFVLLLTKELEPASPNDVYPYICYVKDPEKMTASDNCTCNAGYLKDDRTGSSYKLHAVARSWPEAAVTCAAEGAYLAIINSATEAGVLKELLAKSRSTQALVGVKRWTEQRGWLTVHGQSMQFVGFNSWRTQEHSRRAASAPACGALLDSGLLDDVACDSKLIFICESE